jgi:hypothetical protein
MVHVAQELYTPPLVETWYRARFLWMCSELSQKGKAAGKETQPRQGVTVTWQDPLAPYRVCEYAHGNGYTSVPA